MKKQIIKKGKLGICHFPKFLKKRKIYKTKIRIGKSIMTTDDSCDSGWSKLWGIALGHIHFNNSYRFVYRIVNKQLYLGYYAYIGGVSPQKNTKQKGKFDIKIKVGDVLSLTINRYDNNYILKITNETTAKGQEKKLPPPKGWRFPITQCYPNMKCSITNDIYFDFIK